MSIKSVQTLLVLAASHAEVNQHQGIEYYSPEYWERRYNSSNQVMNYEWYRIGLDELRQLLQQEVNRNGRMMLVGCGSSPLTMELWREGYRKIFAVDISASVISRMQVEAEMAGAAHDVEWRVVDATAMTPQIVGTFSTIIDKGTYHALSTKKEIGVALLSRIFDVLEDGGVFICITVVPPEAEALLLKGGIPGVDWHCATHTLSARSSNSSIHIPSWETYQVQAADKSSDDGGLQSRIAALGLELHKARKPTTAPIASVHDVDAYAYVCRKGTGHDVKLQSQRSEI